MSVPKNTELVDERTIRRSAKMCGPGPNAFSALLKKAGILQDWGLTPAYIYDPKLGLVELTTEERLNKKLH